jgi:hypothetical protein
MPKYGWKKDEFNRHALYLSHWAKHEGIELKVVDHIDLRRYTAPLGVPWDQGDKGSCVGHGVGVNLSARAVEQGVWDKLSQRFSPEWIYDGAREIEGTSDEDAGAMPDNAFLWLEQNGCLPESFEPYTERLITLPPSRNPEAEKWPCHGHYRVDNGPVGLQASLSVGNFTSIGIPFFKKWEDAPTNGILPDVTPTDEISGGHEMCLFGHFPVGTGKKMYFIDLNSWGDQWGEGGWCYIPASAFEVMKVVGGYDSHFPRLPWK